ncbi:hypothetical protein [Edaphobacter sp.]|uniref:hypothetical protein n=1 Tax=Edaphobacter sp. TaxID=1934404 RepID=UPI002DB72798|nr:hypothetical protein [Edaphobacter sp.]HEU5340003.1 hypothetical protein [Edaphobacter sp.]
MPQINRLYLAVMPLVHLDTGFTEQTLTLFPSQEFATFFTPEEVDTYLDFFKRRAESYLKGGNVTSYEFAKEPVVGTGFVRVVVTQHVE